jgi:glutathione reductase (NADPH)
MLTALAESGVDYIPDEEPRAIHKTPRELVVKGTSGKNYPADLVIEAIGRLPQLGILAGDGHRVQSGPNGVVVNEYLQSVSNPRVYAIGDVADTGYQLASTADQSGMVAAENILNGNTTAFDTRVVARSVFTVPNLARVGMTENEARARDLGFRIYKGTTTAWPSSLRIGEKHSFYKILVESPSGRILGADLLRHQAAEVVNTLAMAIRKELTIHDLKSVLWAYPTYTSDLNTMLN